MASEQVMSGAEKAAVFLLSIGEEYAASILKHLDPMEVQNVGAAMTSLSNVTTEKVAEIVGSFVGEVREAGNALAGNEEYMKNMLHQALGEDKAKSMLGRILNAEDSVGLDALKWMEPKAVAAILKDEHPQICAVVLLSLDGEQSAEVLKLLPEDVRPEIIMRVANVESINPDILGELDALLHKQVAEVSTRSKASVDGVRLAAQILTHMDSTNEGWILDSIESMDEAVCESIREKMLIFENLMSLDDREIQRLLREVETESLVLSLKGTEEFVRERFFNNMSKRAAEMLREDIDLRGPIKLIEVETAQKEILTTAGRLAEEGEINFGNKEDDDYV